MSCALFLTLSQLLLDITNMYFLPFSMFIVIGFWLGGRVVVELRHSGCKLKTTLPPNTFEYLDMVKPEISHSNKLLQFTLLNEGYDMMYVHSNFRNWSVWLSVLWITFLWSNQYNLAHEIISHPSQKTYFFNYNTAGKVFYACYGNI